jgi:hypothetical protein
LQYSLPKDEFWFEYSHLLKLSFVLSFIQLPNPLAFVHQALRRAHQALSRTHLVLRKAHKALSKTAYQQRRLPNHIMEDQ